jgi:hypothetical protein
MILQAIIRTKGTALNINEWLNSLNSTCVLVSSDELSRYSLRDNRKVENNTTQNVLY